MSKKATYPVASLVGKVVRKLSRKKSDGMGLIGSGQADLNICMSADAFKEMKAKSHKKAKAKPLGVRKLFASAPPPVESTSGPSAKKKKQLDLLQEMLMVMMMLIMMRLISHTMRRPSREVSSCDTGLLVR